MCCVLFMMERFDDDTGPFGLSTAQGAFSCWGGMALRVAKDGRGDRIAAAVVWAIKRADAFRELHSLPTGDGCSTARCSGESES